MTTTSPLAGQRILITGATGVLGRALAMELAKAGADLILVARRKANLEQLDDAFAQAHLPAPLLVELDFLRAKEAHYTELAQGLSEEGLDGLVICSGLHTGLHPLEHLSARDWNRIMDVNLNGPFLLIRALLPLLKARHGQIVGVSAPASHEHKAFWGAYAVSKAGLDALLDVCEQEAEEQLRVSRFEPPAMPSPIRGIVYPGERREDLPAIEDTAAALRALLESQARQHTQ